MRSRRDRGRPERVGGDAESLRVVPIGELVESVQTWNPAAVPEQNFTYVDLSAYSDLTGTNFDQFNDTWSLRSNVDWLATVTGRLGYAINNVLLYGRGGAAWAHDKFEIENAETNLGTPAA